ncbi:glycogen synthase GlgA [Gloeobacter violaceus]|uniref:Glycogen synthase n=1 Tax=Gloeobacter violaceus (strain ATCC 29082 / PCC 7421) TaxID=251221 RepID=GLGA_GLOVI|nr:glycogen synthase GlgA [Gloeobacter violaceus]Q7NM37.1 RecName: Full=Glycogen synthase; AltName: Full=Starch [bacterial glycogen] synthase [Gloeobacter violaceus PCC 7421]BAC88873.1 glycogen synthase [Gloeobacter violaceus PCC 7421]
MKVLFAAAECAPLAKVGGMADVVGSLPLALAEMGLDVRIILPYYGFLGELPKSEQPVWTGGAMFQQVEIYEARLPGSDIPLYLVGHPAFANERIYGFEDEAWRFTLFSRTVAEFLWRGGWDPQVLHCHDWHTGLLPLWMRSMPVMTVFTIHNLAYQGPPLPYFRAFVDVPYDTGAWNPMVAGIIHSDAITAVSPTYAREICTPEYGERLDGLLRGQGNRLTGILNGINTKALDPATDKHLTVNYDTTSLDRRVENKLALQREFGFEVSADRLLVGIVSRLVDQKGFDLLAPLWDNWMHTSGAQLVVLGSGDPFYEFLFRSAAERYPDRIKAVLSYNVPIAQRIYGGADLFLMPSRFEPCGIGQMIALRYGAVPLVRKTGGLADTVFFHNPLDEKGNGFLFDRYDPANLLAMLYRAEEAFRYKDYWRRLQLRGMEADLSWRASAHQYADLYKSLIARLG